MTTKTRKPTKARPVTRKVAGRKPKPLTLDRVTYQFGPTSVTYLGPLTQLNPIKEEYEKRTRFTVYMVRNGKRWGPHEYRLHDRKLGTQLFTGKTFSTRAAAWNYLRNTTTEDREYRLEMLNRALDRTDAA
jgi:hypothetical protein